MVRNVWFNFAGYAVTLTVTFFISPLMVHHLGNIAYGVWALVQQFVGYSLLLDFGIRIAVTRFLAQHYVRSDRDAIDRLLSTASLIALVPACVVIVAGGTTAYFFPYWFSLPQNLVRPSQLSLLLVAIAMAISGPGSLFTACVAAVSRYDLLTIRNSVFALLRGVLLWMFLSLGYGLITIAIINLVATLVALAMDIRFAKSEIPGLRVSFSAFDWSALHKLLHFSFFAFLISIAVRLVYWSDNLVVGAILGPAAVAFYAVGGTMVQYARDAMDNLTRVYAPLSAQMDALGMREPLQRLYISGSRLGLLAIVPGAASFILTGPAFLALWMGPEFGRRSGPIMTVLSGTLLLLPLASIYTHALYAVNRHRMNAFVALIEAFSNLTLSIWLVHRLGIVGAAWGTLIPATFTQGVIMPVYAARILGVSPLKLYDRAVLRPLLAGLPSAGWFWFAARLGWLAHWGSLVSINIFGVVIYVLVVWRFVLGKEEKASVIRSVLKTGLASSWVGEHVGPGPAP